MVAMTIWENLGDDTFIVSFNEDLRSPAPLQDITDEFAGQTYRLQRLTHRFSAMLPADTPVQALLAVVP